MHRNVKLLDHEGEAVATLRYTHTAFRLLEDEHDLLPSDAMEAVLKPSGLAIVVGAGLLGFKRRGTPDAEVTDAEVAQILDQVEHQAAVAVVQRGIELGWFDPTVHRADEKDKDDEQGKEPSPTPGDGAKPKPSVSE